MPSENKTQNYELNQWMENEYPRRTDFVEDNAKVDAAIKAASDKVDTHKDDLMPHKLYNAKDGKYYRFGEQISADGKPQLIFEEV